MSLKQRLERLEGLQLDQLIYEEAQRLVEKHGGDVEAEALQLREIHDRVSRYGLDAEIRRVAKELGQTEDELCAELDALRAHEKQQ